MSVVIIMSGFILPGTWASGVLGASGWTGSIAGRRPGFCLDPVELEEVSMYLLSQRVGFGSSALDALSCVSAKPVPSGFAAEAHGFDGAISGGGPLIGLHHAVAFAEGVAAAMRATVSSSFMACVRRRCGYRGRKPSVAVGVGLRGSRDEGLVGRAEGVFRGLVGVAVLAAPALVAVTYCRRRRRPLGSTTRGPSRCCCPASQASWRPPPNP